MVALPPGITTKGWEDENCAGIVGKKNVLAVSSSLGLLCTSHWAELHRKLGNRVFLTEHKPTWGSVRKKEE